LTEAKFDLQPYYKRLQSRNDRKHEDYLCQRWPEKHVVWGSLLDKKSELSSLTKILSQNYYQIK